MIVTRGIGSNRLITSGYGWKFGYAAAIPVVEYSLSGGAGLPWQHIGYVPHRDRPPDYVVMPRRPRREKRATADDLLTEAVDVDGVAALEGFSLFPDAPTGRPAEELGGFSVLQDAAQAPPDEVPPGPAPVPEPVPAPVLAPDVAPPAAAQETKALGSRGWVRRHWLAVTIGGLAVAGGAVGGWIWWRRSHGDKTLGGSADDAAEPRGKAHRPPAGPRIRSRKRPIGRLAKVGHGK